MIFLAQIGFLSLLFAITLLIASLLPKPQHFTLITRLACLALVVAYACLSICFLRKF